MNKKPTKSKKTTKKVLKKARAAKPASKVGVLLKTALLLITELQKYAIRYSVANELYYRLSSLHFKLSYGKKLSEEALKNSKDFKTAAKRHGQLVSDNLFKSSKNKTKNTVKKLATKTFRNNFILETEL